MPTQNYNASAAAAMVGVSPSTLRNWTSQFATHLSPAANPDPGNERILTNADVAILQRVKELRDNKLTYDQINSRLVEIDPSELQQPVIDVTPQPVTIPAPQPQERPTTGPDALQIATAYLSAIARHTDPLQQRMEQIERGQVSRLTWGAVGFLLGLVTALIAAYMVSWLQ